MTEQLSVGLGKGKEKNRSPKSRGKEEKELCSAVRGSSKVS